MDPEAFINEMLLGKTTLGRLIACPAPLIPPCRNVQHLGCVKIWPWKPGNIKTCPWKPGSMNIWPLEMREYEHILLDTREYKNIWYLRNSFLYLTSVSYGFKVISVFFTACLYDVAFMANNSS